MKEFSETHNFDHIHTILVKRPKISPAASCQELLADASNETGSLGFSLSIVKTALSPLRSDNHTCHCLVTPALPAPACPRLCSALIANYRCIVQVWCAIVVAHCGPRLGDPGVVSRKHNLDVSARIWTSKGTCPLRSAIHLVLPPGEGDISAGHSLWDGSNKNENDDSVLMPRGKMFVLSLSRARANTHVRTHARTRARARAHTRTHRGRPTGLSLMLHSFKKKQNNSVTKLQRK